jgi:hypothetical protein
MNKLIIKFSKCLKKKNPQKNPNVKQEEISWLILNLSEKVLLSSPIFLFFFSNPYSF